MQGGGSQEMLTTHNTMRIVNEDGPYPPHRDPPRQVSRTLG